MFGTLNNEEIENLIHQQFIGRIGCHADGTTYVVPLSYAYDGIYIYGHTFEGMKVNIMRKNPKICFQVDNMRDMSSWQSVISWGEFEELHKTPERTEALQILTSRNLPMVHSETMHLSPLWPFPLNNIDDIEGIVFRIRLTEKTGRFEKSTASRFFAT